MLDVALIGALPGLGAYARFVAPHTLEVTEHRVPVRRLPAALDGLRIAHLTDFHLGKTMPMAFIDRCVRLLNESAPDIVALTGDYLQWDDGYIRELRRVLSRIESRFGVFAVLGNHDYGLNSPNGPRMLDHATDRLVDAMRSAGVHVLRNGSVPLDVGGVRLDVVGVEDIWSGEADAATAFANLPERGVRLFLCHNPDGFGYGRHHRFDLMLAGHTHGAQIRLPMSPAALLPVRDQRLQAGFYGKRGSWLYVNRGLGYIWKVRLNSAPEIACHTLRPERWGGDRPYGYRRLRERWRRRRSKRAAS